MMGALYGRKERTAADEELRKLAVTWKASLVRVFTDLPPGTNEAERKKIGMHRKDRSYDKRGLELHDKESSISASLDSRN